MLGYDFKHAARALRKSPALTVVAVLSLALGIGANTAIFSVADAVLFRELPIINPEELTAFERLSGRERSGRFSYPLFEDLRDHADAFNGVIARDQTGLVMGTGAQSERVRAEVVSENYFEVLGIRPYIGRVFTPSDARAAVVVLSHRFWRTRFGADAAVIGGHIELSRRPFTVIGIAPQSFNGLDIASSSDVIVPITAYVSMNPGQDLLHSTTANWAQILARRKPGVTLQQAQAAASTVFRGDDQRLRLFPAAKGISEFRSFIQAPLLALLGITELVLLIACANVANLMLARAAARRREIAIRLMLGASRARLLRHFLAESVLLAACGGSVGIMLAMWMLGAVPACLDAVPISLEVHPNLRMLGFAVIVSGLTAVLCGITPAWQSAAMARPHRFPLAKALVASQAALSLVLLIGTGLFVRTLLNLRAIDLGFEPEHVLMLGVGPAIGGSREQVKPLYPRLLEALRCIPGVLHASISSEALLSGAGSRTPVTVEGYAPKRGEDVSLNDVAVTPGYFATTGIPLLLGRDFTVRDAVRSPKVAIVNESTARYFFGNANPIGRRFGLGLSAKPDVEIVGVVKDSKYRTLREQTWRTLYLPSSQADNHGMTIVLLRTARDPLRVAPALKARLAALDPNLFIWVMRTLPKQIEINIFSERLIATLAGVFGSVALLLACVGVYGVMSHAVARRTREIGIRMAVGAARGAVLWLVIKDALRLLTAGVAIGIPVALAATRAISSLLYNVQPADPVAIAAASSLLAVVALLAAWIPARRAANVDPTVALRQD